jgi:hypothetical protein
MKIEIQENESKEKVKYPCLMISDVKQIVLMTRNCEGTVIYPGEGDLYKIGEYLTGWYMQTFKPFMGRITLEND